MEIGHRGLTTAPIDRIEAGIRLYPLRNLLRSNATFKEVATEYSYQDPDVSMIDKNKLSVNRRRQTDLEVTRGILDFQILLSLFPC